MKSKATRIFVGATLISLTASVYLFRNPLFRSAEHWYYKNRPVEAAIRACKADVKDGANDPDSIEWKDEELWRSDIRGLNLSTSKEILVRMTVRGRNGFGAKVISDVECSVLFNEGDAFVASVTHNR